MAGDYTEARRRRPGLRLYSGSVEGFLEAAFLKERIEARLGELLPSLDQEPRRLYESVRYSALAPGKKARALLCLASAHAVGGETSDALDAACAIEMVHAFSLIHDDLPAIDNDDLRRGRPTNHKLYGEAVAILAGDALFAEAFRVALRSHADRSRAARATLVLADASAALVNGEVLDILSEGHEPELPLVQVIHERKTAALIGASCEMGAILGGGSDEEIRSLRGYGEHVGIAFQIADDILNVTATPETLGKATGSDAERGKLTYPAVMGIEKARAEAARHRDEALACLTGLPGPTEPLVQLARFVVDRQY